MVSGFDSLGICGLVEDVQECSGYEPDDAAAVLDSRVGDSETDDGRANCHDQHGADARIHEPENGLDCLGPAESRVIRAHDPLGKNEVHDEQNQHAGLDEDAGGHSEVGVARMRGPRHAERQGDKASHA